MSIPLSQLLVRNTLFNALGKSWGIVLNLLLVPFLVTYLGVERFGLWALLAVLSGYFGLIDFGFGSSFVKYVAACHARSDTEGMNQVVRVGILYYFVIALFLCLLIFPWIPEVMHLFKVSSNLFAEARFVLGTALIVLAVQNIFAVFGAVLNGLQRMDVTNKINMAVATVRALGMAVCIVFDFGLKGLMVNQLFVSLLKGLVMLRAAYCVQPQLRLRPWTFPASLFREMYGFGAKVQVSRIAQMIAFQMDRVLIGLFFNVTLVAFYDIAIRISTAMRAFPLMLTSAIVPAASELDTQKNRFALVNLHLRGAKYLIFLSTPLVCFVIIHGAALIRVWVGPGFEKSVGVLQFLALGYYLNLVSGTASTIAMGMGRPDLEMRYGIVMACLNLALSLILIMTIGFYGAALGSALSLAAGSLYFMVLFHHLIDLPFGRFLRLFLWPLTASIAALFSTALLLQGMAPTFPDAGRGGLALFLGTTAVLFGLLYLLFLRFASYFERDELLPLLQKLPWSRAVLGRSS